MSLEKSNLSKFIDKSLLHKDMPPYCYANLDWDFYWSLEHQAHRDLAYLLQAPCLLASNDDFDVVPSELFSAWFTQYKNWIVEDAKDPQPLLDFVNTPRQYKLGLYAEDLLLYFLEHQSEYSLLLHDRQVFRGKQCIGSMDFLIQTPTGQVEHWEMAIKFFLQRTPSLDWIDFVGPSHVDSMHRKLTKMVGRQLNLCDTPEAKELLAHLSLPLPTAKKVLSVGRFFGQYDVKFLPPKGCDPNQPQGHWIKRTAFSGLFSDPTVLWKVRLHPLWIAPYLTTERTELLTTQEVLNTPMEKEKFLMLSQMKIVANGYQECHRWILVIDDWGPHD